VIVAARPLPPTRKRGAARLVGAAGSPRTRPSLLRRASAEGGVQDDEAKAAPDAARGRGGSPAAAAATRSANLRPRRRPPPQRQRRREREKASRASSLSTWMGRDATTFFARGDDGVTATVVTACDAAGSCGNGWLVPPRFFSNFGAESQSQSLSRSRGPTDCDDTAYRIDGQARHREKRRRSVREDLVQDLPSPQENTQSAALARLGNSAGPVALYADHGRRGAKENEGAQRAGDARIQPLG
jgi:hypothetical protein